MAVSGNTGDVQTSGQHQSRIIKSLDKLYEFELRLKTGCPQYSQKLLGFLLLGKSRND